MGGWDGGCWAENALQSLLNTLPLHRNGRNVRCSHPRHPQVKQAFKDTPVCAQRTSNGDRSSRQRESVPGVRLQSTRRCMPANHRQPCPWHHCARWVQTAHQHAAQHHRCTLRPCWPLAQHHPCQSGGCAPRPGTLGSCAGAPWLELPSSCVGHNCRGLAVSKTRPNCRYCWRMLSPRSGCRNPGP